MSSPSENNEPGRVDDLVGNVTAAALREMRLNSMSPSEPERPNASPLPFVSARPMDPVEMYSQDTETTVTETSTRLTGERETDTTVYPNDQPTGGDAGMEAEDVEVTVLDPDHPLMRRFQEAFREQTQKQIEEWELRDRELTAANKRYQEQREELGVNLYEIQQELGRQQAIVEEEHDKLAEEAQKRRQVEQELAATKSTFKTKSDHLRAGIKRNQELQTENEMASGKLFAMQSAKEDVRKDIQTMRGAAEKADSELTKAELDKQRQDMLVHRLDEQLDFIRQEIDMYNVQRKAQESETKATKEQLLDARTEIESIEFEHKQLYQQWNSCLLGMRRRDEALAAVTKIRMNSENEIKKLDTEIDGYKKSIQDEEDMNEKHTLLLNRIETAITGTKKEIEAIKQTRTEWQQKQAAYSRILAENDAALQRTNAEYYQMESKLEAFRSVLEKEADKIIKLQGVLNKELMDKMTQEKSKEFSDKVTGQLAFRMREVDMEINKQTNKAALDDQKITETRAKIWESNEKLKLLNDRIEELDKQTTDSENGITKMRAQVERKQTIIDQMSKKLHNLVENSGGEELAPLEMEVASLAKSLEQLSTDIAEAEVAWLKQQHELVRINQEKDKKNRDVKALTKKVTILQQKKIRIESEIEADKREYKEVERNIEKLRIRMDKASTYSNKKEQKAVQLEQDNILHELEFIQELKEKEMDLLNQQRRLEELTVNNKRLEEELIETEKLVLLWERKIQLAKETIAAVNSDVCAGEIKKMKSEIHRMELKYKELMKEQERLMREMEHAVTRRDTIQPRPPVPGTRESKTPTRGSLQKKIMELKRTVKNMGSTVKQTETKITALRAQSDGLSNELEDMQLKSSQWESKAKEIDEMITRMEEDKHVNLIELVIKQNKTKEYQKCLEKKYKPACKDPENLPHEVAKIEEKFDHLGSVVDQFRAKIGNTPEIERADQLLGLQPKV